MFKNLLRNQLLLELTLPFDDGSANPNLNEVQYLKGGPCDGQSNAANAACAREAQKRFWGLAAKKGICGLCPRGFGARAINSNSFQISDDGKLTGDDPSIWLEQLRGRGSDEHLFQPSDPQRIEREKVEHYGYCKADFEALPPEKRLALVNQTLAK